MMVLDNNAAADVTESALEGFGVVFLSPPSFFTTDLCLLGSNAYTAQLVWRALVIKFYL